MTYYQFKDSENQPYGSFEVFYADIADCADLAKIEIAAAVAEEDRTTFHPGYYWWACFPGCMPDGDPSGPFRSEEAAVEDALGGF